ncbi:hypothetical protein BGW37DRAFT_521935 [Umbelopsis sp. PMI_123]|nr:hypothetical protein BGW37DRAFT_521935 [Umbelopsis sp. PMI_123]
MIDDTPVAFETKKLSTAECNYPTQERATSHSTRTSYKYPPTKKSPALRLVRWFSELKLYEPMIKYKQGNENTIPDKRSQRKDLQDPSEFLPMEEDLRKSKENMDLPLYYLKPSEDDPADLMAFLHRI